MTDRERLLAWLDYQPVDRPPLHLVGPWADTTALWRREGLPAGTDVHSWLGVRATRVVNVSPNTGVYPPFQPRVLEETAEFRIAIDGYGRTVRDFKDHTSMPEWLDFPVKTADDLRRVMDEHYRVDQLDARFPPDWEIKLRAAAASGAAVLTDGGCYYWTLRSLAGVEHASLLFHDAPELVDELFRRYQTVVMEGIRRATARVRVDLIGFGEDVAYKNGPLISPAAFRRHMLPVYREVMALAHAQGVTHTWFDSDGDLRALLPDLLSVGINTVAPCEVAAGMAPVELRRRFGRALRLIGGVDKREVARGPAAIDAELARLAPVIADGGFLPAIDHSISADISLENYRYFLRQLHAALGLTWPGQCSAPGGWRGDRTGPTGPTGQTDGTPAPRRGGARACGAPTPRSAPASRPR